MFLRYFHALCILRYFHALCCGNWNMQSSVQWRVSFVHYLWSVSLMLHSTLKEWCTELTLCCCTPNCSASKYYVVATFMITCMSTVNEFLRPVYLCAFMYMCVCICVFIPVTWKGTFSLTVLDCQETLKLTPQAQTQLRWVRAWLQNGAILW